MPALYVDPEGRFVEVEQLGFVKQRPDQGEASLHAAGEGGNVALPAFLQLRKLEWRGDLPVEALPGHVEEIGVKPEVGFRREFLVKRVLGVRSRASAGSCADPSTGRCPGP